MQVHCVAGISLTNQRVTRQDNEEMRSIKRRNNGMNGGTTGCCTVEDPASTTDLLYWQRERTSTSGPLNSSVKLSGTGYNRSLLINA